MYYYIPIKESTGEKKGDVRQNPDRNPPWLVIDHQIETLIVTQWPGTLWSVKVIDPIINSQVSPSHRINDTAGYTRAVAIELLEELPVSILFGQHGQAVCAILDKAQTLTYTDALQLSKWRSPNADTIYSEAWNKWLQVHDCDSIYLHRNHVSSLVIPIKQTHRLESPINKGFMLLQHIVRKQAISVSGTDALVDIWDDIEEVMEDVLAPVWSTACAAMLDAAMALGAPQWLSESDQFELCMPFQLLTSES